MIGRRSLASGVALLCLLGRSPALAQVAGNPPRIVLMVNNPPLAEVAGPDPILREARAFVHGLRDLGWVDGRNIVIERRSAEGRPERVSALVREAVDLRFDVIVAYGGISQAVKQATDTIPIVSIGPDLVGSGLANTLAQPGGNITGFTYTSNALNGKRLELLKQVVPAAIRIAVIRRGPEPGRPPWQTETIAAAGALGLQLSVVAAYGAEDLDKAFATLSRDRPHAIFLTNEPWMLFHRDRIVRFAARERLPAMYPLRAFVEAGGLMSYGVDNAESSRRAAAYVDKILKGAKPAELPIEQPTRLELVINQKAAKALGLAIPRSIMTLANEVIR